MRNPQKDFYKGMTTRGVFQWTATISLFLLLAALFSKGLLWLIYGGYYYRSNLTVFIAASFGCLVSALVILYASRVPALLARLIPRTRLAKLFAAAVAVLILYAAFVFWPRPNSAPDLVKEYEQTK
jgi:hypothetical protein